MAEAGCIWRRDEPPVSAEDIRWEFHYMTIMRLKFDCTSSSSEFLGKFLAAFSFVWPSEV